MRLACLTLALLISACAHGGQGGGVTYCPRPQAVAEEAPR